MVAQVTIVPGIGTLHHQIRRDDAARPCIRHGRGDLLPCVAAGFGDGTWLEGFQRRDLHGGVADGLFQIRQRGSDAVGGIQADVGHHFCFGRNYVPGGTALHLSKGHGGAHQRVHFAAALFAESINDPAEAPHVGENHPVQWR